MDLSEFKKTLYSLGFICHESFSDWGGSILVMERSGKAFARTYWFNDDTTIYFDWLSVDETERKRGIATELLNAHIEVAKKLGIISMLWVKKGTWMQEWYKRKGYQDYQDHKTESDAIWMRLIP